MSVAGHSNNLQTYQSLLYRRALHPELFQVKARRGVKHNAYELEAWIMPGGHVLRFKHGNFVCTELVTDQESRLPVEGAVTAIPCAGEHEFEHSFPTERVKFITSIQTESLSETLYNATYDEIIQLGKETGGLTHIWADPASGFYGLAQNGADLPTGAVSGYAAPLGSTGPSRRNLSMLDIQRLGREIHVQAYHLIAQSGWVLRTQTIFEHR